MVLPLCRCRVLYIGSAVPTVTKDGLQGIQQPLRERYPVEDTPEARGVDSWLSVWSNGILLEYIEGDKKSETAFFPINSLHYCAAVRYVNVTGYAIEGGGERFLPLDSPFADIPDSPHPPMFAAILRRTSGVKILECHGFICTNSKAANALVRCCFHAYADCMYLRMDERIPGLKAIKEGSLGDRSPESRGSEENNSADENEQEEAAERQNIHHWDRERAADGEYDSVSIGSSMAKGTTAKRAASENGNAGRSVLPYAGEEREHRRAGSDVDLSYAERYSIAPPPGALAFPGPRGAPHGAHPPMFPPHHPGAMPLPMHMMPPPPPGRHPMHPMFFAPPPPHFMPHPGMMMPPPPPPHLRGQFHPGHFPPPPRGFFPPPFHPMYRPGSPDVGTGPIITGPESIYGTIPRKAAYEEPAYVSTQGGPPEASYHPGNYTAEQYEAYYDTLKKKTKKGSASVASSRDINSAVWEQYEEGIYRKPHINEKAFSNTLRSAKDMETPTLSRRDSPDSPSQIVQSDVVRPDTPPIDYNIPNGKQKPSNRAAAY
ncbi:unnamed protein product [Auanema sp. JU1783]|nr:unnamed protein product [Auanema sp. JU1783]